MKKANFPTCAPYVQDNELELEPKNTYFGQNRTIVLCALLHTRYLIVRNPQQLSPVVTSTTAGVLCAISFYTKIRPLGIYVRS